MKTQMTQKMIGAVFLALGLAACGGPSTTNSSSSDDTVAGSAMFGPVRGGTVKAYALKADGSLSSTVLAQTTTDQNGTYSLKLSSSGPVALAVTSGTYNEEGSGQSVTLLRSYIAVLPSASGQVSSAITPLSHAAWKAFQASVSGGIPSGKSLADMINLANSKISEVFGVNVVGNVPSNPFGQLANDESGRHAIVLAAFSKAAVDAGADSGALAEAYGKLLGQNGNLSSVQSVSVMSAAGVTVSVNPPSISSLQTVINNVGSGTTQLAGVQSPVGFVAPTLNAAPTGSTFNLSSYAELVVDDVNGGLSMTQDMKLTQRIPFFNGVLNGNGHTLYVSLPELTEADQVSQECLDAIGAGDIYNMDQSGYPIFHARSSLCKVQDTRFNRPLDGMNAPVLELGQQGVIRNVKVVYVSDLKSFGSSAGLVILNDGLIENVQISQKAGVEFKRTSKLFMINDGTMSIEAKMAREDYFGGNVAGAVIQNRGAISNLNVNVTMHNSGSRAHSIAYFKSGSIDRVTSNLKIYTAGYGWLNSDGFWANGVTTYLFDGVVPRNYGYGLSATNSSGVFSIHWDPTAITEGVFTQQQIDLQRNYVNLTVTEMGATLQ